MSGKTGFTTGASAGTAELYAARKVLKPALLVAFVFSVFVNLLMLTAPLYMLQVYDRVLVSRSSETLVALSLLAAGMFVLMGVIDHARSRITARIAARLQTSLDGRVLTAALARLRAVPNDSAAHSAQNDINEIARFWASPAFLAILDTPWTPLFIAAIFVFHPWLGWLAASGGALLLLAGWLNQRATDKPMLNANRAALAADRQSDALKAEVDVTYALGMAPAALARWRAQRELAQRHSLLAADIAGRWAVFTRTFRLFLQSAMLGLAAYLAIGGQVSGGAMIASSILMGRALQPLEMIVAQWATVARARQARLRLAALLANAPADPQRTPLPRPTARLEVAGLTIVPPGGNAPLLRGIGLDLSAGQAMGVIGGSGAGKSVLARALTGIWKPVAGHIRLGGATLDQYEPSVLGRAIGYLPQRVILFEGTVAENISRLDTGADPAHIVAAAHLAAAHDMILRLPQGYDTIVGPGGGGLSGGQMQRIGLARALYGNPVMLVLDEPDSSLDVEGSTALAQAIRGAKASGAIVLIMAHRPAALQDCESLLVLKDGKVAAMGPRDSVLREMVRNASDITRIFAQAGAA
ncbi:type I secretion system permease/ATPase [Tabrizicola sp. BL-A-41-H6]|uniref:type I secretion system permease/ATPase n=1 Tax=Tabrizicola sp. BL-A-41-H6 TaxID=3421107 RepID=UPI003D66DC1E